ncbi:MAG: hypothetical protein QNJ97_25440 [Myxococcota bacterium]|nr:hypothetical protein [Myxococcota bacterium]
MNFLHKGYVLILVVPVLVILSGCSDQETSEYGQIDNALMEDRVDELRRQIVTIAEDNTDRLDNIDDVRAELEPLIDELGLYFNENRPADEIDITRGIWKNIWFDDKDIGGPSDFFDLDRNNIYQVIEDGYYYNVSENSIRLFGDRVTIPVNSYLRGDYQIIDAADDTNVGQPRLNVVDLEFVDNRLRLGRLPRDIPLDELADRVDSRSIASIPVPGPIGITGELWNLYIDEELRISAGSQDGDPGVTDLYILRRAEYAGNLLPFE